MTDWLAGSSNDICFDLHCVVAMKWTLSQTGYTCPVVFPNHDSIFRTCNWLFCLQKSKTLLSYKSTMICDKTSIQCVLEITKNKINTY